MQKVEWTKQISAEYLGQFLQGRIQRYASEEKTHRLGGRENSQKYAEGLKDAYTHVLNLIQDPEVDWRTLANMPAITLSIQDHIDRANHQILGETLPEDNPDVDQTMDPGIRANIKVIALELLQAVRLVYEINKLGYSSEISKELGWTCNLDPKAKQQLAEAINKAEDYFAKEGIR